MRNLLLGAAVFFFTIFFLFPEHTHAAGDYTIDSFDSTITINEDASILVRERIQANFFIQKHGILRHVPVTYSAGGKTIKTQMQVVSVEDESGISYPYTTSRFAQSLQLKIGDPDKTITGINTYVITYKLKSVLQEYDDHVELYWNVVGSEWDTNIANANVSVTSDFAKVEKVDCFAGRIGTQSKLCSTSTSDSVASATSSNLGLGRDLTIVLALNKDNELIFPSKIEKTASTLFNNWGYFIAIIPALVLFSAWNKRGRDQKYVGDNIYYKPEREKTETVNPFHRNFLPLVYHPINGLTPAEVGTIVDERVDIHDVVAEIVELARIGFLEIIKINTKSFLSNKDDYLFVKTAKTDNAEALNNLRDYQAHLLKELFRLAVKTSSKKILDRMGEKEFVSLSTLKNVFYPSLAEFKSKLYERMDKEKLFEGNPEKTRSSWLALFVTLEVLCGLGTFAWGATNYNFGPILLLGALTIPGGIFAWSMPRRTAWGYSLYRQIEGLNNYLQKGKWRHEIAEKKLFFESVLPLAIALGVVDELAKKMQALGVPPPSYFIGVSGNSFARDLGAFSKSASGTLVSAPGNTGRSSWSGGSGFSGGSSGGGFGGGGGGSW